MANTENRRPASRFHAQIVPRQLDFSSGTNRHADPSGYSSTSTEVNKPLHSLESKDTSKIKELPGGSQINDAFGQPSQCLARRRDFFYSTYDSSAGAVPTTRTIDYKQLPSPFDNKNLRPGLDHTPKTYQLNRPAGLAPAEWPTSFTNSASGLKNNLNFSQAVAIKSTSVTTLINQSNTKIPFDNRVSVPLTRPADLSSLSVASGHMFPIVNNTNINLNSVISLQNMFRSHAPRTQEISSGTLNGNNMPLATLEPASFQIPRPNFQMCTNNNSRTSNTQFKSNVASKTVEKSYIISQTSESLSETSQVLRKMQIQDLSSEPSTSKTQFAKPESVEPDVDIETVAESEQTLLVDEIQTVSRKESAGSGKCQNECGINDSLTDTINRVAKGENELMGTKTSGRRKNEGIEEKSSKSVEIVGSSKRKTDDQLLMSTTEQECIPKKKKKKAKSKSKMKVTVVKSPSPTFDSVGISQKSDRKSTYMPDPKVGFHTYNDVVNVDNEAVAEIETQKLSSVSGHHLLSLTESEKEYLRNKSYIGQCTFNLPPTETKKEKPIVKRSRRKANASDKKENGCREPSVMMVSSNESETSKQNKTTSSVNTSFEPLRSPVVKITKLNIVPINTSTTVPVSMQSSQSDRVFYVVNNEIKALTPDKTHNTPDIKQPNNEYTSRIVLTQTTSSKNDTKATKGETSHIPEGQQDKYIQLGNVSYRLVQNQQEKLLIRKSGPNIPQLPSGSSVTTSSSNSNKTVSELLKLKRTGDQSPSKGLLQMYAGVVNGLPNQRDWTENKAQPRGICPVPAMMSPKFGQIPLPTSVTEEYYSDKVDTKNKVRLQIPIRVIRPQDVVIKRASSPVNHGNAIKSRDSLASDRVIKIPTSNQCIQIVKIPEKNVENRKTLPAPKPKDQVLNRMKRSKLRKPKSSFTQKGIFINGFRKVVKAILAKSTDPLIQMAQCLDLVPKEEVLRKIADERKKTFKEKRKTKSEPVVKDMVASLLNNHITGSPTTLISEDNTQHKESSVMATVIQIFKDDRRQYKHNILQVTLTFWTGQNMELKRWYPNSNRPSVLHFDVNGHLSEIEVEDISNGLYVALDCVDGKPLKQKRSVATTLSVYPPSLIAIPTNTLALVISDTYSRDEAVNHKLEGNEKLQDLVSKILKTDVGSNHADQKYGSVTDTDLSPRCHSSIFYTGDYFSRFEREAWLSEAYLNQNNNKCFGVNVSFATAASSRQEGLVPKFSERAMALKMKQNELFESCKRLKTREQLQLTKIIDLEASFD